MTIRIPQGELDTAMDAARKAIDDTGYGSWVSNDVLRTIVVKVIIAIEEYRTNNK